MQESVSMHSRMNQARLEEEEKETKRDGKDGGQEDDGKNAAQENKFLFEELKQGLPKHSPVNTAAQRM